MQNHWTSRYRLTQHTCLAIASTLLLWTVYALVPSKSATFRLSMASAYSALLFLALSLILGPRNVLWNRPNPISTNLRRDIGIWAGILGIAHTVIGLQAHMGGKFWLYFVQFSNQAQSFHFRRDAFGIANHTGLAATFLLFLLLVLSNDLAVCKLGPRLWKNVQRWNYAVFVLVLIHGVIYQHLERRANPFVMALGIVVALTVIFQLAGAIRRLMQ